MPAPKLLDQVRNVARLRHLSLKTEQAYARQIKRFILFHNKRHPEDMGEDEIRSYLSHLAVDRKCRRLNPECRIGRAALSV